MEQSQNTEVVSRRGFLSVALLGLLAGGGVTSCLRGDDSGPLTHQEAVIATLVRSMFETEQALVYVIYKRELSREAWQKVFDRAVERVQAGRDLWDEGLWLEHPETDSRSLGPLDKHLGGQEVAT